MPRSRHALITFGIFLLAFVLRGYAFANNPHAYADVNLMSVAAKEYAVTSTVRYPWVLERFEHRLDDPLATPAYMHGAAYPFLGGLLAKIFGTRDTFVMLKLIDLMGGMALVAVTMALGRRFISQPAAWIAGLWVATSPVLVDFSGNGSPYIMAALATTTLTYLCMGFRFDRLGHYAALGAVCALGLQMHAGMLILTAVSVLLGLMTIRRLRVAGVGVFALAWVVCYLPSLVWYMTYFGRPFVSQQIFFIISELPIPGAERAMLRADALQLFGSPYRDMYLRVLSTRLPTFFENLVFELGAPMLLWAGASGIGLLATGRRRFMLLTALPAATYFAVTAIGLALLHMRFLVPVVPALLIIAATGLATLTARSVMLRRAAAGIAVLYAGWSIYSYMTLDNPPARYFRAAVELETDRRYTAMDDLAAQINAIEPGTVIGCEGTPRLAYPFDVRVISIACPATAETVAQYSAQPELNIRYALVTPAEADAYVRVFPDSALLARNDAYVFIRLDASGSP